MLFENNGALHICSVCVPSAILTVCLRPPRTVCETFANERLQTRKRRTAREETMTQHTFH